MKPLVLRFWEAYLRTEYWVGPPDNRLLLQIGEPAIGLSRVAPTVRGGFGFQEPWAYITAWNPGSEIRMEFMNRQKQEDLERLLRGAGYVLLPGIAHDSLDKWPDEEGLLALGLGWEKALMLGRQFNQNAILAGIGEETVQLLRC